MSEPQGDGLGRHRDLLVLHGLRFFGHHGVSDGERRSGGEFIVDLEVAADIGRAQVSDDVADTVNYVELYGVVRRSSKSANSTWSRLWPPKSRSPF